MKIQNKKFDVGLMDFIPALSGLIGKTALVTSFAVVWAKELNITTPGFVFENVRMELMIASVITLIGAMFYKNIAPSGTLAPLVVLVPAMASFGVHPFILSILVGLFGILSIKTKLFHWLLRLSGQISKTSLTLTFGISGVFMASRNLISFFGVQKRPLIIMTTLLILLFIVLNLLQKIWLIIPVAAAVSIILPFTFGMSFPSSPHTLYPNFNPSFWWNEMWGIGFGFEVTTILKTFPFALFVILLWAIDTVSITTMFDASGDSKSREVMDIDHSFLFTSIRNMVGGICGGAQTGALWRSFLIPLFMVKRPLYASSILLGVLGLFSGFFAIPIKIMSYPPLIWSVLLFGIFLPFVHVGMKNLFKTNTVAPKISILFLTFVGVMYSPILTWASAIILEKLIKKGSNENKDRN